MGRERAAVNASPAPACLAGPGEMAAAMRAFDWGATPLGPAVSWPGSLQTVLRILLGTRQAMWLVWGPQLTFLYNDACRDMALGDRHSGALGRPIMEAWPQIWPVVAPRVDAVLSTGHAAWDEQLLLLLERGGPPEETYHALSYSPLADEAGRIAGVLCLDAEETGRVLQARRLRCLREVDCALAAASGQEATIEALCQVLAGYGQDLPFTLTYLFDDGEVQARLACATGIAAGHPAAPTRLGGAAAAPWPADALRRRGPLLVDGLGRLGPLPCGAWDRPPSRALVAPLTRAGQDAAGFIVVGLNPFQAYGGPYQQFLELLVGQASTSLAHARARDHGRQLAREAAVHQQAVSASSEEAEGMKRLHEFSARLLALNGLQPLLEEVLDATMALHDADFGLVQQFDPQSGDLLVVAQRNLPEAFLAHFARVHDDSSACGRAMLRRERVIIEDVMSDAAFAPHRAIAADTGLRAMQSTPLISRAGELLGVISTQFRQACRFTGTVLRFTDLYARQAADIVERNRAQEALRASEERFRRYFDLGLIGMALTSPAKGCIDVNDELCRIFGYSREELLHKNWPELTHPDDLAADVMHFERVLAREQEGYVLDKRFIRKDGSIVWCTMAAQCLRARDGSVDFFVALVQDRSERVAADDALRRARDQLAHVARVAAMGELVASIAHEMNQPLAAIVANGHASIRWLTAQPPDHGEAVAAVSRIVADAHRASEVIARIRRFVRRSEAERGPVDLHGLACEVASMLEPEARSRQVRVHVEAPGGESLIVPADRVQLQQVVVNLVMNGFEAMAAVPQAQRLLQIRVEREGPQAVRVSVRDAGAGVGVEPRERERIFDAFYTSKPAGMGMGLAISRSIVEAHEGRLWCAANPDGGETFSFTLPA
jgi:PAS domain S-box-containing protein